jgi:hypothetical protein
MTEIPEGQYSGQGVNRESERYFTIEAAPRLGLDQNLYDQEPFGALVTRTTAETEVDERQLRSALSLFADAHFANITENPHYNELQLLNDLPYRPIAGVPPAAHQGILRALQDIPYWSEYISRQRESQRYNRYGKKNPSAFYRGEEAPISYAQWVTEKLQSSKRLRVHGIDEVFLAENLVTALPNQTGVKPATRTYRILRASEISKRK